MHKISAYLRSLQGWRRYGLAWLLGAFGATAFAPTYILPAFVVSMSGLIWLVDGASRFRQAFFIFWFFAWGLFVAGYYWIGISFLVDAARFAALLPLPVLGLPAFVALLPAFPAALGWRLSWRGPARILVFAVSFSLGEWLQSWFLTGLPWNPSGSVWGFSALTLQPASLIGIQGMGLFTLALAALPALYGHGQRGFLPWVGAGILVLGCGFGFVRLMSAEIAYQPGISLRLVQPSIPQTLKWVESERAAAFQTLLTLSESPGVEKTNLWVWPESALAYFIEQDEAPLTALRNFVGSGRVLLTGTIRRSDYGTPLKVWNSLVAITGAGIEGRYDKHHLVPFGEYLPFRTILGAIGLDKLAHGSVDFSSGVAGDEVLQVAGVPPARVLICYEALFATEVTPVSGLRAAWILNVTNDAWFGNSSGPYQHLAAARARAVEQGLPLVRSANNGISAIVDPYGRVQQSLGLDQVGVVDGLLPIPLSPTWFVRFGNGPFAILLFLFIAGINLILWTDKAK